MIKIGKRILAIVIALSTLWTSVPTYAATTGIERRLDTANYEDAVYAGSEVDNEPSELLLDPSTNQDASKYMYREAPRAGITGGPNSDSAPTAINLDHGQGIPDGELQTVKSTDWMIQDKDGYYVNIWGEYVRYGDKSGTTKAVKTSDIVTTAYDILGASISKDVKKVNLINKAPKYTNSNYKSYVTNYPRITSFKDVYSIVNGAGLYDITWAVNGAANQNNYASIASRYTSGEKKEQLDADGTGNWEANNHMLETTEYTAVDSYTINKVGSDGRLSTTVDNQGYTRYANETKPMHNVFEQTVNTPIVAADRSDKMDYTYTRTRYSVNVIRRLRGTNHHSRYYVLGRQFDGKYKFEELVTPYLDVSDEVMTQPHTVTKSGKKEPASIAEYGQQFYYKDNTTQIPLYDDGRYTSRKQIGAVNNKTYLANKSKVDAALASATTGVKKQDFMEAINNGYGMNYTSLMYRQSKVAKEHNMEDYDYLPNVRGETPRKATQKVRFSDLYEDWGFEDYDYTEDNKSVLFYFDLDTHKTFYDTDSSKAGAQHIEDYTASVTDSGLKIPGEAGLLDATTPNLNANYYVQQPNPLDFSPANIKKYYMDTSKYINNNPKDYLTNAYLDKEHPEKKLSRDEADALINSAGERLDAMANAGYFKYWNEQTARRYANYLGYAAPDMIDTELETDYPEADYMRKIVEWIEDSEEADEDNVQGLYARTKALYDSEHPVISYTEPTSTVTGVYNYNDILKKVKIDFVDTDEVCQYTGDNFTSNNNPFSIELEEFSFSPTQAIPSPKIWYPLEINEVFDRNETDTAWLTFGYKNAVGTYFEVDDLGISHTIKNLKDIDCQKMVLESHYAHALTSDETSEQFPLFSNRESDFVIANSRYNKLEDPVIISEAHPMNIMITKEGYVLDRHKTLQVELSYMDGGVIEPNTLQNTKDFIYIKRKNVDEKICIQESYAINLLLYRPAGDTGLILTRNNLISNMNFQTARVTANGVSYSFITDQQMKKFSIGDSYLYSSFCSDEKCLVHRGTERYDAYAQIEGSGDNKHIVEKTVYNPYDVITPDNRWSVIGDLDFVFILIDRTSIARFRQPMDVNPTTGEYTSQDAMYSFQTTFDNMPSDYNINHVSFYPLFIGDSCIITNSNNFPLDSELELPNSDSYDGRILYRDAIDLDFIYSTVPTLNAKFTVDYTKLELVDDDKLLEVTNDLISDPLVEKTKPYYWSMMSDFYSRILFSDYDYKSPTRRQQQWVQPGRDINLAPHTHEKRQYYTYDFFYQELGDNGDKEYVNHTPIQFDIDYIGNQSEASDSKKVGYSLQSDDFKDVFSEYVGRTVFLYDELAKYVGINHDNDFVNSDQDDTTKLRNVRISIDSNDPRGMNEFNPTYKWALYPYYKGYSDFNPFFCDRYDPKNNGIDTYQAATQIENEDSGLVIMNAWDVVWEPEDPREGEEGKTYTYADVLKDTGDRTSNGHRGWRPAVYQPNLEKEALTTATFPMYDNTPGNEHMEIPGIDIHRFVVLVRPRGYKLETENVSVTTAESRTAANEGMSVIDGTWLTSDDVNGTSQPAFTSSYFSVDTSYATSRAKDGYKFPTLYGNNNQLFTTTAVENSVTTNENTTANYISVNTNNAHGVNEFAALTSTNMQLLKDENNRYSLYNALLQTPGMMGAVHYPMLYGQLGFNNFDQRYLVYDNALQKNMSLAEISKIDGTLGNFSNVTDEKEREGLVSNDSYKYLRWGNYLAYKVERNNVPVGYPVIAELLPDYADGLHVIDAHPGQHYNLETEANQATYEENDFGLITVRTSHNIAVNYEGNTETINNNQVIYESPFGQTVSRKNFYNKVFNTNYSVNAREYTRSQYRRIDVDEDLDTGTINDDESQLYDSSNMTGWSTKYHKDTGEVEVKEEAYDRSNAVGLNNEISELSEFNSMSNLKALLYNNFSTSYYSVMDTSEEPWYYRIKYLGTKKSDFTYDRTGKRHTIDDYVDNDNALTRNRNEQNMQYVKDGKYRLLTAEKSTMADSLIYHTYAFTMPSADISLENNGAVNIVYNYDQTPDESIDVLFDNIQMVGMRATTGYTTASTGMASGYLLPAKSDDVEIYNGLGVLSSETITDKYFRPYSVEPNTVTTFVKPTKPIQDDDGKGDSDDDTYETVDYVTGASFDVGYKVQSKKPKTTSIDYKYLYTWFPKSNGSYQVDDESLAASLIDYSSAGDDERFLIDYPPTYFNDPEEAKPKMEKDTLYLQAIYSSSSSDTYKDPEDKKKYLPNVVGNSAKNWRAQVLDIGLMPLNSRQTPILSTIPEGIEIIKERDKDTDKVVSTEKHTQFTDLVHEPWKAYYPYWAMTTPAFSYAMISLRGSNAEINPRLSTEKYTTDEFGAKLESIYDTGHNGSSKVPISYYQYGSIKTLLSAYKNLTNRFRKKGRNDDLEGLSKPTGAKQRTPQKFTVSFKILKQLYDPTDEYTAWLNVYNGTSEARKIDYGSGGEAFITNSSGVTSDSSKQPLKAKDLVNNKKGPLLKELSKLKINVSNKTSRILTENIAQSLTTLYAHGYLRTLRANDAHKMPSEYSNVLTAGIYIDMTDAELRNGDDDDVYNPMSDIYFDENSDFTEKVIQTMRQGFLKWLISEGEKKNDAANLLNDTNGAKGYLPVTGSLKLEVYNYDKTKWSNFDKAFVSTHFKIGSNTGDTAVDPTKVLHIYLSDNGKYIKDKYQMNLYLPYTFDKNHNLVYGDAIIGVPAKGAKGVNYSKYIEDSLNIFEHPVGKTYKNTDLKVLYIVPQKSFVDIIDETFKSLFSDDGSLWDPFVQYQKYDDTFVKNLSSVTDKNGFKLKDDLVGITIFSGTDASTPGIPIQARYTYTHIQGLKKFEQSDSNLKFSFKIKKDLPVQLYKKHKTDDGEEITKTGNTKKIFTVKVKDDSLTSNGNAQATYSITVKKDKSKGQFNAVTKLWLANYYYFALYLFKYNTWGLDENDDNGTIFTNLSTADIKEYKKVVSRSHSYNHITTFMMTGFNYYLFLRQNNLLTNKEIQSITPNSSNKTLLTGLNIDDLYLHDYARPVNKFYRDSQGIHLNRANVYTQFQYGWDNYSEISYYPSLIKYKSDTQKLEDVYNDENTYEISQRASSTMYDLDSSSELTYEREQLNNTDYLYSNNIAMLNKVPRKLWTGSMSAKTLEKYVNDTDKKMFQPIYGTVMFDVIKTKPASDNTDVLIEDIAYDSSVYLYPLQYNDKTHGYSRQQLSFIKKSLNKNLLKKLDRKSISTKSDTYYTHAGNTIEEVNSSNLEEINADNTEDTDTNVSVTLDYPRYNAYKLLNSQNIGQSIYSHDSTYSDTSGIFETLITSAERPTYKSSGLQLTYPLMNTMQSTESSVVNNGWISGSYTFLQHYYGTHNIGSFIGYPIRLLYTQDKTNTEGDVILYPTYLDNIPISMSLVYGNPPSMNKYYALNVGRIYTSASYVNAAKYLEVKDIASKSNKYDNDQVTNTNSLLSQANDIMLNYNALRNNQLASAQAYINSFDSMKEANKNIGIYNADNGSGQTKNQELYTAISKQFMEVTNADKIVENSFTRNTLRYYTDGAMNSYNELSKTGNKLARWSLYSTLYGDTKAVTEYTKAGLDAWKVPGSDEIDTTTDISEDGIVTDQSIFDIEAESGDSDSDNDDNDDNDNGDVEYVYKQDIGDDPLSGKGYIQWTNLDHISYYNTEPAVAKGDMSYLNTKATLKQSIGSLYFMPYTDSAAPFAISRMKAYSRIDPSINQTLTEDRPKFLIGLSKHGFSKSSVADTWIIFIPNSTGQSADIYLANLDTKNTKLLSFNSPITLLGTTSNTKTSDFSIMIKTVDEGKYPNETLYTGVANHEQLDYKERFGGVGSIYNIRGSNNARVPVLRDGTNLIKASNAYGTIQVVKPYDFATQSKSFYEDDVSYGKALHDYGYYNDDGNPIYEYNDKVSITHKIKDRSTTRYSDERDNNNNILASPGLNVRLESTIYSEYAYPKEYILMPGNTHDVYRNARTEFASVLPASAFSQVGGMQLQLLLNEKDRKDLGISDENLDYKEIEDKDKEDKKDHKEALKQIKQYYKAYVNGYNSAIGDSKRVSVVAMDPKTFKWNLYSSLYDLSSYTSEQEIDADAKEYNDRLEEITGKDASKSQKKKLSKQKAFKHYFGQRLTMSKGSNTKKFNIKVKYATPIKESFINDKHDSYQRSTFAKELARRGVPLWTETNISSYSPSINLQRVGTSPLQISLEQSSPRNLSMMYSSNYHAIPAILAASTLPIYDFTGVEAYNNLHSQSLKYIDSQTAKLLETNDVRSVLASNNTLGISAGTYNSHMTSGMYSADARYLIEDVATFGLTSPRINGDSSNPDAYTYYTGSATLGSPTTGQFDSYMYYMNSADRLRYFKDLLLFGSYSFSEDTSIEHSAGASKMDIDIKLNTSGETKDDFVKPRPNSEVLYYNPLDYTRNKSRMNTELMNIKDSEFDKLQPDDIELKDSTKYIVNQYVVKPMRPTGAGHDTTNTKTNTSYYYNNNMLHSYVTFRQRFNQTLNKYEQVGIITTNVDENITPEYPVIPMGITNYASWYTYATRLTMYNSNRTSNYANSNLDSVALYQSKNKDIRLTYSTATYSSLKRYDKEYEKNVRYDSSLTNKRIQKTVPIFNIPEKLQFARGFSNDELGFSTTKNAVVNTSSSTNVIKSYAPNEFVQYGRDLSQLMYGLTYYYMHVPTQFDYNHNTTTPYAEMIGAAMSEYYQYDHVPGNQPNGELMKMNATENTIDHNKNQGDFYANGLLFEDTVPFDIYTNKIDNNEIANDIINESGSNANYIIGNKKPSAIVEEVPYFDAEGRTLVNYYTNGSYMP